MEDGKKARQERRERQTNREKWRSGDGAGERRISESNAWEKKNLISPFAACYFVAWMVGDNYMVAALPL